MLRTIIEFIVSVFRKSESFSKDQYKSVYRKPGEVSEDFEEIKPSEPEKISKLSLLVRNVRKILASMSYNSTMENVRDLLLTLFFVCIVGFGLFLCHKMIFTSGAVEYCYIERWTYTELTDPNVKLPDDSANANSSKIPGPGEKIVTVYELKGQVDFRPTRDVGRFDNFDAAIAAAQKINCPIEKK